MFYQVLRLRGGGERGPSKRPRVDIRDMVIKEGDLSTVAKVFEMEAFDGETWLKPTQGHNNK